LHQLVERTIKLGEGNSVLLIGNKGTGKSKCVETVLKSLEQNYSAEAFHTIKLNGLYHTDDRSALASITKQLQIQEGEEVDKVMKIDTGQFCRKA
jgi:origin recognition complex subunit 4